MNIEILEEIVIPDLPLNCPALESSLEKLESVDDLLHAMGQYIAFNAIFGGMVAHLSGQIVVRMDLFGTKDKEVYSSDSSCDIAARVFQAAIDEFGGANPKRILPHRYMAQAAMKTAASFYNKMDDIESYLCPTKLTAGAITDVKAGYGMGGCDETKLFKAMGFHIGSEKYAGGEFRAWDRFLKENYPDLVGHMSKPNKEFSNIAPYIWFEMHTVVEDEHADLAMDAANLALMHYRGKLSKKEVKTLILDGYEDFGKLQKSFLQNIAE